MKTRMVVPVALALGALGTLADGPATAADPPRLLSRGLFSGARPMLGRVEADEPEAPAAADAPAPRFGSIDATGHPLSGNMNIPVDVAAADAGALIPAAPDRRPAPTPTAATPPAGKVKTTEEAARRVGVTVDELRRLRQLGYLDSEVESLVRKGGRQPREMILEREVLNALGKEIEAINARVWQLTKPKKELEEERDRELRGALTRVARAHRASRDDMRRILAGTSFLNADELKRHLGGPSLFSTDALRRVSLFGGQ